MIQNILTFCVKNDLTYVSGSIPSGKLVANDINRNSIYLITPYDEAIVKANFQTNLQSDTPTSVLGILVNGEIEVSELVDTNASYYNLVKDWNIYEFKVPSTTLSFISRNRTGKIGINFSIEQRLVPMIKVSYGTYKGEITELAQTPTENGYYIIKALGYEYEDSVELKSFDLNDILVYNATTDVATKISAYSNRGSTPTSMYSVDPSLLNDNFETIDSGLTAQIVQQVNDNTSDILLLNQGVLNDGVAITDLQNRMSVAESDIDTDQMKIGLLENNFAVVYNKVSKIENGTTIVEKALRDSLGNIIKDSYVSSVYPTYNDTTDKLFIETYDVQDGLLANNEVILPKATTTKNGLMAKEDKVKVDNIASDISSAITTHDNSATAHLPLRTLINNLQQEVDRINAKGRSWGEIDLTFSQWIALTEPTRSNYINTFLATAFSGYTPSNGDLVYTIVSDTEEEHELEYNSTLSQWIDNGAYIVGKASNTQMGIVKGDLTYVSILNGLIQVLKSDYATNVGSSGASYDYADLLALFTEVANDIYNKSETYSRAEVDLLISNLSHYFNLQETAIEYSTGVYDFPNGATKPYTLFQDYNWVKFRIFNNVSGRARAYYTFIKPAMAVSGNNTLIQIQRTPVRYARIRRTNGDIVFDVIDDSNNVDTSADYTMRCWGEELVQLTASEVDYDNSTSGLVADKVQGAIDELASEQAVNDINKFYMVENENLFNYEQATKNHFLSTTGVETAGSGYVISNYILAKDSVNFVQTKPLNVGNNFIIFLYDANKTYLGNVVGVDNTTHITYTITKNSCYYVRFNLGTPLVDGHSIQRGNTYNPNVLKNGNIFNKKTNMFYNGEITKTEVDFLERYRSSNLFNKDNENNVNGSYILNNGSTATVSGYAYSHLIEVEVGKYYSFPTFSGYYGGNSLNIYLYDYQGNFVRVATGTQIGSSSYGKVLIKDPRCKYARFNFITSAFNTMVVNESETEPIYESFYDYYRLKNVEVSTLPPSAQNNKLYLKTLAVDGDSICIGFGGGYASIIGQRNNMVVQNIAVGGGTITSETYSGETPRHWINESMLGLDQKDYILLEGGVNDYALGVAVGSITNDYTSTLDNETFAGAFETMCKQLVENYSTKKYGYIFVHRIYSTTSDWSTIWKPLMKQILNKWGIPFIDLEELVPPLNFIATLKSAYTLNGDGWHPNEDGYNLFYVEKIEEWMKTL